MNAPDTLPPAIDELFGLQPAVNFRLKRSKRKPGKFDKIPVKPDGTAASTTNPATWTTLPEARAAVGKNRIDGFSKVMAPVFGVDVDHCRNPETGEIDAIGQEIMASLPIYWETSPSGTGIRGFGYGHIPAAGRRNDAIGLEIYAGGRHLTVTGRQIPGSADHMVYCQEAIDAFYARYFPEPKAQTEPAPAPPRPPVTIDISDGERIDKMIASNPKAARLWRGDLSDYIDDKHPEGDASRADAALCSELVWWFDGDRARAEPAFGQSALGARGKWLRQDYRDRTFRLAFRGFTSGYSGQRPTPIRPTVAVPTPAEIAASPCADQIAALVERAEKAEAERDQWQRRAESAEGKTHELQERLSLVSLGVRNPKIRKVFMTGVALVNEAASCITAGDTYADGAIRCPDTRLARKIGTTRQTAGRHKAVLAEWELIETRPQWIDDWVDRETGEIVPGHTENVVRLIMSPNETLRALAILDPEKPRVGDATRFRCRRHPAAPVRHAWQETCTICGDVLGSGFHDRRRPDDGGVQDANSTPDTDHTTQSDDETAGNRTGVQELNTRERTGHVWQRAELVCKNLTPPSPAADDDAPLPVADAVRLLTRPDLFPVRVQTRCEWCQKPAAVADRHGSAWCLACAPPPEAEQVYAAAGGD